MYLPLQSRLKAFGGSIPDEPKHANTLGAFKYFLKKENKQVQKYYYYGKILLLWQ